MALANLPSCHKDNKEGVGIFINFIVSPDECRGYLGFSAVIPLPQRFPFGHDNLKNIFIALIHPIQWTIAKPVGADRPAKRQKKTSCVSTGWPVPVLCICQVAHGIYFLSRQHDVIASFSFGACTVQTCFQQSPDILKKSVHYDRFTTSFANNLL